MPDTSPATAGSAARSPPPLVAPPKVDEVAPVGATRAMREAGTNGVTPQVAVPPSAPNITADKSPRIPASPPTPAVRVPVASDTGATHCSRIVEKAALGEPLSEQEKKELANSCR